MTIRRQRRTPVIHIVPDLIHTYIGIVPTPTVCDGVEIWIKRADGAALEFECTQPTPCCGQKRNRCDTGGCGCGSRQARYLLRYPAYDVKGEKVGFRWDDNLHALPPGRYTAEVRMCDRVCHEFEFISPDCREVGGEGTVENLLYQGGGCPLPDGQRDDTGGTFTLWHNYAGKLIMPTRESSMTLEVDPPPFKETRDLEVQPQLILTDGVIEEVVDVRYVNGHVVGVERGGENAWPVGTCIRFAWTPDNLERAGYDNPNLISYGDLFECDDEGCD
ncbi:MAG: hypothetical protein ACK5MY_02510 [Jhaorihella sp.]